MYYFDAFDLTRESVNNASQCDYWLFIDDLGTEPQFRNHYGTSESPVLETLLKRANNMERLGRVRGKVFATSNKSLEQLNEFYGPRLYSRLQVLFNIVIVSGDIDHRTKDKP
jgi:DNA replication protein DnaC